MMLRHTLIISALLLSLPTARVLGDVAPEVADADAMRAFKTYWGAFEEYERRQQAQNKEKFQKAWGELKAQYDKSQLELQMQQEGDLKEAIRRYQQHLAQHPNTPNRPYTMLNLAQAYIALADLKAQGEAKPGDKKDALALLNEIEKNYPGFEHREATIYMTALVLESQKQDEAAVAAWKRLASTARTTLYGVHALIAVGDAEFRRDNPRGALAQYKAALSLLNNIDTPNHDYETVRAQYRIAWAAYRGAELETVVAVTTALLAPGRDLRSAEYRRRVQQDSIELLGDAIYEQNDSARMTQVLKSRELQDFAASVALRAMQRYDNERQYEEVITIGNVVVDEFLSQSAAPDCLNVLASAHKGLGHPREQIAALERLAMMLPKQSLWRAKHKDNFPAVSRMENNARFAAKLVAAYHYDRGMNTGSTPNFIAAGSFYDVLIDNDPTGEQSSEWRLRRAHCAYFAGDYREAVSAYAELKQQLRVTPDILEVAAYQSVLAQERLWQEEFSKGNSTVALQEQQTLEQQVQDFVNRFPEKQRAVDLMLVLAGSYRDTNQYDAASKFWQRALISKPTPPQRAVAIRGLVMAQMRLGSPGDVAVVAKRYLKLENWSALGISLANELLGVLSAATMQEGDRLNKAGQSNEAGAQMVTTAAEFAALPNRDRIYRDGAYMLAIGGNWDGARKAALAYKKTGLKGFAGDMQYLEARASEYLIRFGDAARAYYALGMNFPNHPSAVSSLGRAETLAAAEGDFALAGKASQLRAGRTASQSEKMQLYSRSVDHFNQAGDGKSAGVAANTRLSSAKNAEERMTSRLLAAKTLLQQGKTEGGIAALSGLANDLRRQKSQMSPGAYSNLYGETNVLLGDDMFAHMEDFNAAERSGNIARNVDEKMGFFERLNRYYEQAASTQNPEWSAKARFQTAEAAERFADEIVILLKSNNSGFNVKQSQRFLETSKRLRELTKRNHSDNLAIRANNPNAYRQNTWVRRSSVKLTGVSAESTQADYGAPSPTAVQSDLPSQWSL